MCPGGKRLSESSPAQSSGEYLLVKKCALPVSYLDHLGHTPPLTHFLVKGEKDPSLPVLTKESRRL